MYMFTDWPDFCFDHRNIGFGDTAILITDLIEFLKRVKAAAAAVEKPIFHGPVEYVDKKIHDGQMGPFRKFSEYEYQSEFRLVMVGTENEPNKSTKLSVGDIRDIVMIGRSDQLPGLRKVKEDASHQ